MGEEKGCKKTRRKASFPRVRKKTGGADSGSGGTRCRGSGGGR